MKKKFQKIIDLRKEFLIFSYWKWELLKMIDEIEVFEHVYNSNAIENSTLSLEETEKILLKIDLNRFISERELFEAKNLAKVVEYINKKAEKKELINLNLDQILFFHKILLSNIRDDAAWRFRKNDEWVRVWNYIATDPKLVNQKIQELLINNESWIDKNIIEKIALFHLNLENIHPFVDWNWRIWRVLNNYLLVKEWYVPINIKFSDRKKYYEAFKEFDKYWKTKQMEDIIFLSLLNSYHKRLAYLKWLDIVLLNNFAKKSWLSYSNLLNKANRQTIPAFLEKWVWKIWV